MSFVDKMTADPSSSNSYEILITRHQHGVLYAQQIMYRRIRKDIRQAKMFLELYEDKERVKLFSILELVL